MFLNSEEEIIFRHSTVCVCLRCAYTGRRDFVRRKKYPVKFMAIYFLVLCIEIGQDLWPRDALEIPLFPTMSEWQFKWFAAGARHTNQMLNRQSTRARTSNQFMFTAQCSVFKLINEDIGIRNHSQLQLQLLLPRSMFMALFLCFS